MFVFWKNFVFNNVLFVCLVIISWGILFILVLYILFNKCIILGFLIFKVILIFFVIFV